MLPGIALEDGPRHETGPPTKKRTSPVAWGVLARLILLGGPYLLDAGTSSDPIATLTSGERLQIASCPDPRGPDPRAGGVARGSEAKSWKH